MTHPEHDTPIAPVSEQSVVDILEAENLDYRLQQDPAPMVRTGFTNAAVSFAIEGDYLLCDSMWRGQVDAQRAATALAAVNEWNLTQLAPTLRFFESAPGTLAFSACRRLHIAHGLSRNQTGAFVMSTLDSIVACFQWLEAQFPEAITWDQPHENHGTNSTEGTGHSNEDIEEEK
ncbi:MULTISPECIES: YbjN domain-containing protein [unclassified Corynebacterium]|uniref:YbjN domain-containing protein n=1 Tax=unclassified Corynebacterium TaxID=2624378 RepID=UPI0029CA1269|nr:MULTISPECIES: YbjN domain-containing protein [unclassified Corynebacterium]WPF65160.1 YbjN domain-containing protein [Corynebacterium sp. 22KM0430]WPF67656.1 YbjN domain-containing protein [Corynebacterium sp. 21KM1197]